MTDCKIKRFSFLVNYKGSRVWYAKEVAGRFFYFYQNFPSVLLAVPSLTSKSNSSARRSSCTFAKLTLFKTSSNSWMGYRYGKNNLQLSDSWITPRVRVSSKSRTVFHLEYYIKQSSTGEKRIFSSVKAENKNVPPLLKWIAFPPPDFPVNENTWKSPPSLKYIHKYPLTGETF